MFSAYFCSDMKIVELLSDRSQSNKNSADDVASAIQPYFALKGTSQSCDSPSPIMIVESPKVIKTALESGCFPISLLCERKHITGDASEVIAIASLKNPEFVVYTAEREYLSKITGYTLTRGVLCCMKRPMLPILEEVVADKHRIAVIDNVCDSTNIGSIFRAAAAMGVDGVIVTKGSCDPLNRRSIRVSMGTVFRIPWTWIDCDISILRQFGYRTAALALRKTALHLDDPRLAKEKRLALILGTEGDGLLDNVIDEADYSVVIPMHYGVDSLNVASAAAVAFWQLRISNK